MPSGYSLIPLMVHSESLLEYTIIILLQLQWGMTSNQCYINVNNDVIDIHDIALILHFNLITFSEQCHRILSGTRRTKIKAGTGCSRVRALIPPSGGVQARCRSSNNWWRHSRGMHGGGRLLVLLRGMSRLNVQRLLSWHSNLVFCPVSDTNCIRHWPINPLNAKLFNWNFYPLEVVRVLLTRSTT